MITIVGSGLVGSLWAVMLRKKGFDVQVFEKRPDPRKAVNAAGRSINLVITSRGLYGLEKAGLRAKAHDIAVPVYGRMIHNKTGDTVYQPYGQSDECNLSISRDELNRFLISEAEAAGAKIYFEHELSDLNPENKTLSFSSPSGITKFNYDVLFGTDGSGSRVRKKLIEIFPNEFKERIDWLEADYKELTLPLGRGSVPQIKTSALHIWPRGDQMMMALANKDGSFTVTVYLPKKNFSALSTPAAIENLFKTEFPDAIPLMPNYVNEFVNHPQGALGTVRCSRWVYKDSIALMGDAAHAIVPFFGQGMNAGFEDCTNLLALLDKRLSWGEVLKTYEETQKPNANAIADMALENWVEMRDKVGDQNFLMRKKIDALIEQKHPDIYKSRYGLITYTLAPYSLAQEAGIVQGRIIDQLLQNATPESVSWERADELLQKEWLPFVQQTGLSVERYR